MNISRCYPDFNFLTRLAGLRSYGITTNKKRKCDRFAALKWHRIRSLELKSYVTIFILLTLPLGSFYDIVLTKIIYTNGLYFFPNLFPNLIVQEFPNFLPDENNQWISPLSYTLMVEFSFQIFEFKLYIFFGVMSMIMFPVIQIVCGKIVALREAVPQLIYGALLILLTVLGIQTHYRFVNLIRRSYNNKNAPHIITKIRYFIDMNKVLTLTLFIMGASFLLLGSDVLINSRPIAKSKVASDILVAHMNFAAIIEWLVLILIFYPRKGFVGTGAGGNSLHSTIHDSTSQHTKQYSSNSIRDSYVHLNSYNDNNDRYIESDKYPSTYPSTNDFSLNESTISASQMLPAVPTPAVSPPNSISSNSAPSVALKTQLKRNISLSRDGRMVYGDTKPLGKVGGSEFVAVEKADPSDMPFYLGKSSIDANSQQYPNSNEPNSRKSTQEERMLVLQRMKSQNSLILNDKDGSVSSSDMRSQQSLLINDGDRSISSSIMKSQKSVLFDNEDKNASNSVNIFNEDQQVPSALSHITETASELSYTERSSEAISYEESDDGYFYAM
ncbi:19022_t:CDS:2 [Dentiscutata erythropus]|uniref:19022_t:CDS:1 n=1 Tax=Dentiscutata erythropus TaxID=1348616 RepID=A0A9N9A182_9GLOM|nr:19022_t:CDS:2 [Dentiscutata erythropus]